MTHNSKALSQEQKYNNLRKIVVQAVKDYSLPLDSKELNTWRGSNNKELVKFIEEGWLIKRYSIKAKYLNEYAPNWYDDLMEELEGGEKSDRIKEIIEHWKQRAKKSEQENKELKTEIEVHLEAIETGGKERWTQKEALTKDLTDNVEMLRINRELLSEEKEKNKELQKKLEDSLEMLEEVRKNLRDEKIKSQGYKNLLHLNTKSLPKLPKKFKIFKKEAKTKFQNLVEKTKFRTQEIIAQIEVKVK